MREILGNNLKRFFDTIDNKCNNADITYAGNRYEVWEVSDELFQQMCDMSEEEFVKFAGEDVWWRQCDGSNLGVPNVTTFVNGEELICWNDDPEGSNDDININYSSLTSYLCNCVGASQPKNVCACAMDLAKYNNMSMGELFKKFEG